MQTKSKILVLDGKVVSRKFYTRLLESFYADQHVTLDKGTGKEGIQACDLGNVGCVVVASRLPDCTGLEFLKWLVETMGEAREVPAVMLAEEDNEEEAKQAIKAGAFDYLVKGRFSPVSLVQAVKNAMEAARLHRELAKSRRRLLDNAHKAGMAEIANGLLHNIGNNMNSVATSVDTISAAIDRSRMRGLHQANQLLSSMDDLLGKHPKGRDLLRYYRSLEAKWEEERALIIRETATLQDKVTHIRGDIYEQTHYANTELYLEELDINKVVVDSLRLQQGRLDEDGVVVDERCQHLPRCMAVRVKLLLILNNLIKNSIESLGALVLQQKLLTVGTLREDFEYCIFVSDNGPGIDPEDSEKVFNYGFTTKESAHGAGLHLAANAATEMGGRLTLESGDGMTTFKLYLPLPEEKGAGNGA